MNTCTFLPNPGVLSLDHITVEGGVITFLARAVSGFGVCPVCRHQADRVHSHYRRQLLDLPWQGNAVRFDLHCRKFFCDNRECKRHIFTEPLPAVAERYARKTCRLADALQELCYLAGGEAAARIARAFGLLVSADSLLRDLKRQCSVAMKAPRVLGIDDFAFRRGHAYGTLLVDLERRVPVDLLPDREAKSVETWLREHPGVEIISRDRGIPYIEGSTRGTPDATQIADRWHLLKNLGDSLERFLIRNNKLLREAACLVPTATLQAEASEELNQETNADTGNNLVTSENTGEEDNTLGRPLTRHEQDRQHRRGRRLHRYEEVRALFRQGLSIRAIGKKTGLDRRTVRKFATNDEFPEISERPERQSKAAPFADYIKRRWTEGCHNGALLRRELQALGYDGSQNTIDRFLSSLGLRAEASRAKETHHERYRLPSPRRVAWLMTNTNHSKVDERDRILLERLGEMCPDVKIASEIGTAFCRLVRERRAEDFDAWMQTVNERGPLELKRFAKGLVADKEAVLAGLSLVWSNGQTEGQVNRLKFIKRQMYGRAGFDLLRARVLPQSTI